MSEPCISESSRNRFIKDVLVDCLDGHREWVPPGLIRTRKLNHFPYRSVLRFRCGKTGKLSPFFILDLAKVSLQVHTLKLQPSKRLLQRLR